MPAEYRNPDGTISQGYFCMTCGQTVNMMGTGHGLGKCEPNPSLVAALIEANKKPERRNTLPARSVGDAYLIWSNEHRAWWRPASSGYTTHVEGAGRYSRHEALSICRDARGGWRPGEVPPEIPVREVDALDTEKRIA